MTIPKKFKLKPSIQQAAFYHWVEFGTGSCVLEAVAGSGKTTTLIEAVSIMSGTIFFGAYNKNIAEEISARAGIRNGLTVSTMHAAGMRAWKKVASRFFKVDANKVRDIFRDVVQRVNPYDMIFEGPVVHLVSLAKQSAVGILSDANDNTSWLSLINHFSVEIFDEKTGTDNTSKIVDIARHCFNVSNQMCKDIIDFDDMIFAPLFFNVSFDKYDWVLIDEAQDTNATRREMALRMMKPTTRLVAVGDRHQAIYGFTGADAVALDLIGTSVHAKSLPLTVTFRCPKAVVACAQQWVSHIQCADTAPEGLVRQSTIDKLFEEVQVGDAILCRFNAPLIKNVYQLIAKGIPARVEGREIGAGLKQLAMKWKVKDMDQLLEKLDNFLEREVAKFTEKENHKGAEAVSDKVECLRVIINRVILKGTITKPPQAAVIEEIDAIFGTNDKESGPVVILSSIHKSKGREWKKVVWLTTGLSPFAKLAWEIEQENNLCYVAATRSMNELVLIPVPRKGE